VQGLDDAMGQTDEAATVVVARPGRRRWRWWLIGGSILLLLAGGGAAAARRLAGIFHAGGAPETAHGEPPASGSPAAAAGQEGDAPAPPAPAFVDMPDLLVNLRSEARRARFLKLRITLEVPGEPAADGVRMLLPRVMDSFQLYLRALGVDDLDGAAGMQRLKEELLARANLALAPARIDDVLVKEMLVQ
jgi:flagellar FliL protein